MKILWHVLIQLNWKMLLNFFRAQLKLFMASSLATLGSQFLFYGNPETAVAACPEFIFVSHSSTVLILLSNNNTVVFHP